MGELQSCGLVRVCDAVEEQLKRLRLPRSASKEEIAQEVHARLAEDLGRDYVHEIEQAMAKGADFEKTAANKAIMRCLWKAEYELVKKGKRKAARGAVSLSTLAEPEDKSPGVEAIDMAIDLANAMKKLTSVEQQVWNRLHDGLKTTEIARELGMPHQRVSELSTKVRRKIASVMFIKE